MPVRYFPSSKAALDFQYRLGLRHTLRTKVNPGESQMFTNLRHKGKNIFGVRWKEGLPFAREHRRMRIELTIR